MACSIELTIPNLVFLGVLIFAAKKLFKVYLKWRVEKMLEKYENTPKDKVILHTVWRCKPLPSISPYAMKLETYLRAAKIPYEIEHQDMKGPKGKLPWITYNGVHVADSHLIIQFLNKKFSVDLNKNSSPEDVTTARACRVMLEEHFWWGLVQYRGVDNISAMPQLLKIPPILKLLLPIRSYQMKKRMEDIGMGKHTTTEIYQMTEDDLRTVSSILGSKKFFGGDLPNEEDFGIFGFVSQAVWGLPGSSFERLAHGELRNLKEYSERMKEMYWLDWESCTDRS